MMTHHWAFTLLCLGFPVSCAIAYAIIALVNVWMDEQNDKAMRRIIDKD